MPQDDEPAYDNTHRAFLQVFLARSTLTLPQAKPILASILSASRPTDRPVLPGDVTDADFTTYIAAVNSSISPFDLEIRSTFTQGAEGRTRIWALVNTTSDAITQLATTHSADEIAFVKRVIDDIFDKFNTPQKELMAISNMHALQLARVSGRDRGSGANRLNALDEASSQAAPITSGQSISGPQAEAMLRSMVEEGWFEKERDYYTLSPRALMELRGWLIEAYNEVDTGDGDGAVEKIKLCHVCKEIVTSGQRCGRSSCKGRLHDHCAQGLWRMQRNEKCPICKRDWTRDNFVGIRAVQKPARGQTGAQASRRSSEAGSNGEEDEESE